MSNEDLPIRLTREGELAVLTLCRPDQKNAVTPEWISTLQTHADTLHRDGQARVVLLQAEGPMFCVGADLKSMAEHLDDLPAYIDSLIRQAHEAILRLLTLPVPVIGLLSGTAAGGGASLALACDMLVAARSARLVLAYAKLGTTPDLGLSHALIERVGPHRALQLFLLADGIAMDEALRLGLIQELADDDEAPAAARRMAARLATLPSVAAKALFMKGRHEQLALRLNAERASFQICARTDAFRERVLSFSKGRRG
ncbi:MAG: enoyl-CoA hydratase/isomerase family protein [Rubrivivax sp.]|nr:enoyl-CoA hydratase/isomerase family protein [Rubrivivax sp.]